jgi:hypothetical protein
MRVLAFALTVVLIRRDLFYQFKPHLREIEIAAVPAMRYDAASEAMLYNQCPGVV